MIHNKRKDGKRRPIMYEDKVYDLVKLCDTNMFKIVKHKKSENGIDKNMIRRFFKDGNVIKYFVNLTAFFACSFRIFSSNRG